MSTFTFKTLNTAVDQVYKLGKIPMNGIISKDKLSLALVFEDRYYDGRFFNVTGIWTDEGSLWLSDGFGDNAEAYPEEAGVYSTSYLLQQFIDSYNTFEVSSGELLYCLALYLLKVFVGQD